LVDDSQLWRRKVHPAVHNYFGVGMVELERSGDGFAELFDVASTKSTVEMLVRAARLVALEEPQSVDICAEALLNNYALNRQHELRAWALLQEVKSNDCASPGFKAIVTRRKHIDTARYYASVQLLESRREVMDRWSSTIKQVARCLEMGALSALAFMSAASTKACADAIKALHPGPLDGCTKPEEERSVDAGLKMRELMKVLFVEKTLEGEAARIEQWAIAVKKACKIHSSGECEWWKATADAVLLEFGLP